MFDNILIPSDGSNCLPDADRLIVSITNILACESRIPNISHHSYSKIAPISQLPDMNIIQQTDIFAYMAGYLLKKNNINCNECRKQLYYADGSLDYLQFIQEKEYRENAALFYPAIEFTNIIKYIESIFLEKI